MRRLVLVGAILYFVVLFWAIAYLPQRVSIDKSVGWSGSFHAPQEVLSVDPQGEASGKLQIGDKIVALDNEHQFSAMYRPSRRLLDYAPRTPYTLTVLRHGELVRVPLVVPAHPNRSVMPFLVAYLAGSLGFLVCAIIMGWKRPDNRTAQIGWLACLLTAFFYIYFCFQLFPSWSEPRLVWVIGLVHPWHIFAAYCFIASFGASEPESRWWRCIRTTLAALCFMAWVRLFSFSDSPCARFLNGVIPHWILFCLTQLTSIMVIAVPLAMIAVLIRNYRAATTSTDRRRLEIVAGAIAGSLTITSATNTFQLLHGGDLLPLMLGNLAPLPIPVCFCYAVVAHKVLDIRLVVRRGLQYLLAKQVLRILGLLPLIAIVVMALRHPNAPMRSVFNLTGLGLIFLVALCLEFRERIQLSVDRWFLRERFDREKLIRALLADIAAAESSPHLAALVDSRLRHIYSAEFVELRDTPVPDRTTSGGLSIPLAGLGGDTVGWLSLGPRRSDEAYAPADIELIDLVASQVGLMRHMFLVSAQVADVTYAVQEERTRIAQELHDTVEQGFAGISLYLAAAGRTMQDSPGQASAYLEAARNLAKTSARETRESVRGIRSSDLSTGGNLLEARLRRIADRFVGTSAIAPTVALDLPPGVCELASDDAGWHLARVAEEAVTNACKHASANQIKIGIHTDGQLLKLTIKDDGAGFELRQTVKSGFGLQGMRERMGHVLGAVEIISSPGHGTEVCALVPIGAVSSS